MSLRVTAGFLAALVILAAVVLGLDKFNVGKSANGTSTPTSQVSIFQFDDKKVVAFEAKASDTSVRFEKSGDQWKIAGSDSPPNTTSLTSLIIRMSQLKATQQMVGAGSLDQYGLDKPADQATAQLDDGTQYVLQLGQASPVGNGTYVKTADSDTVYLIPSQFGTDLERLVTAPEATPTPAPSPSGQATSTSSSGTNPLPPADIPSLPLATPPS